MKGNVATCHVCGHDYTKKMVSQRYCSRSCYTKAWFVNNPEKVNARQRARRKKHPAWYHSADRRYYVTHRGKMQRERPWKYLLQAARVRALQKRIPYELTNAWAGERWTGRCEITKLPFAVNGRRGPFPFSASIDRIDSTRGYTQDNTRFVLWGCNAVKGVGTDADMLAIAKAIVAAYKDQ